MGMAGVKIGQKVLPLVSFAGYFVAPSIANTPNS